jgi:opacity protein-like surface antigen
VKNKVVILPVLGILACAGFTSAQTRTASTANTAPLIAFRPFFLATFQRFEAQETFKVAFGHASQPFFGGGLDVTFRNGIFVDLTISRFSRSGQRAFLFNGRSYPLGIPLTVKEVPVEVSAGYRFPAWHRIRPYAGGGFGHYSYKETSDFSTPGEDVDMRHAGYLVVGGGEVRLNSWVAIAVDVQWTHVPGILGTGGLSQGAGSGRGAENDLGGIAPRLRVLVGH